MSSSYTGQLRSAVSSANITGASFAYWDGTSLHTAVAGQRNSVTGDRVTVDTVMHIGSITKVMTTVLMMQLVDEGRIGLDDPIVEHLPELRLRDMTALKRITCAMLVNHTSGIDGDWLPGYGPDQERIVDAIDRCADLGQLFFPGEAASYCNIATVIAGCLTQRLRGESWYTLVKTRIYDPLGMPHALADVVDAPRFRCSVGDLTDPCTGKAVQTTRPFLSRSFAPAGSTLMTSAVDLVTFARTMLNGGVGPNGVRILSAASCARMTQITAALVCPAYQVGLGWMIAPGGVLTHSGVGPGVYSLLFAHPASGRAMALLTNADRGGLLVPKIVDPILESWTGIKNVLPRLESGIVDTRLYDGVYENNLQRIDVLARDGGLSWRLTLKMPLYDTSPFGSAAQERAPSSLAPLGNDTFEADSPVPRAPKIQLRFVKPDNSGRMQFLGCGYRLLARTA